MAAADTAHELPPDALWHRIEAACSSAEAQGVAYKCAAQRFLRPTPLQHHLKVSILTLV